MTHKWQLWIGTIPRGSWDMVGFFDSPQQAEEEFKKEWQAPNRIHHIVQVTVS